MSGGDVWRVASHDLPEVRRGRTLYPAGRHESLAPDRAMGLRSLRPWVDRIPQGESG